MLYDETVVCNEIRWEYGLPKWKALRLIDRYKQSGEYGTLCRLIQTRHSISKEECESVSLWV